MNPLRWRIDLVFPSMIQWIPSYISSTLGKISAGSSQRAAGVLAISAIAASTPSIPAVSNTEKIQFVVPTSSSELLLPS
jgi:hypothetical protein